MDLSTDLHITPKGVDEVKQRVYKLGMKKRSVLILLDTPKSLAQVIDKSVFPEADVRQEVDALIGDGFIHAGGAGVQPPPTPRAAAPAPVAGDGLELDDEIILSEAKFLLSDFAVDSFGTHAQGVVDAIRACRSVVDLRSCLGAIAAVVDQKYPAQRPALRTLITEINATAA